MKFIGRIISISLLLLLLLQPLGVLAAPAAAITTQAVTAAPGETATIVLKLENNPGINSLQLKIRYDSDALTLLSATDQNLFGSAPTKSKNLTDMPYNLIWATPGNTTESGELLTLCFQVSETAPVGSQTISISASGAFDEQENAVTVTTQNAEIAIEKPPVKILSMAANAQSVTASVQIEAGISAKALCGIYDADGKMISIQILQLQSGENALRFTGSSAGSTAKLFVLESTTTKPLCAAMTAE